MFFLLSKVKYSHFNTAVTLISLLQIPDGSELPNKRVRGPSSVLFSVLSEDGIWQLARLTTAGEGMWMIDTERGRI